jgi:TolB protein
VGNSSYGQQGHVVLVRWGTWQRIAVRAAAFHPAPRAIAFSPDGRYLAVPGVADYRREGLYAYDLRRGRTTRLLTGPVGIGTNLSWSADGRGIAFSRDPGTGGGIYILDLAARKVSQLTTDGVDPAWSPDGAEIAFVSHRGGVGRSCTEDGCEPNGEIDIIRTDGSDRRRLTHTRAGESRPAWSADGAHLVAQLTSDEGGSAGGVVVFRADGSCYRVIVPPTDGYGYQLASNALRPSRAPLPGRC